MVMKLQISMIKRFLRYTYSSHTCLAVTSLDSALQKDKNCYPQVFLKECKYIEKKVFRYIIDDLESSSDDSDDSDEE